MKKSVPYLQTNKQNRRQREISRALSNKAEYVRLLGLDNGPKAFFLGRREVVMISNDNARLAQKRNSLSERQAQRRFEVLQVFKRMLRSHGFDFAAKADVEAIKDVDEKIREHIQNLGAWGHAGTRYFTKPAVRN
jgi:hypothetical protein